MDLTPAEIEDLELLARTRGLSADEGTARWGWRIAFADVANRLADAEAGNFADARAASDEAAEIGRISFKGSAPSDMAQQLADVSVPVEVHENLGWSEQDLVAAAQRVHFALLGMKDVVEDISTDPDTVAGMVTIAVNPVEGMPVSEAVSRLRDAIASPGPVKSAIDQVQPVAGIEIAIDTELSTVNETIDGGGKLDGPTGQICTAGFTVYQVSDPSRKGVLTAQHCVNNMTYFGHDVLSFIQEHLGTYGDIAWHRAHDGGAVRPQFYTSYSPATWRDTLEYANPVVNEAACIFGRTSGRACSEVWKVNQCAGSVCNLVKMFTYISAGGDSGGRGTSAIGRLESTRESYGTWGIGAFSPRSALPFQLSV